MTEWLSTLACKHWVPVYYSHQNNLQIKHLEFLLLPQKILFPLHEGESQSLAGLGCMSRKWSWDANPHLLLENVLTSWAVRFPDWMLFQAGWFVQVLYVHPPLLPASDLASHIWDFLQRVSDSQGFALLKPREPTVCRVYYIPINWPKGSDSIHWSTKVHLPCFDGDKLQGIMNISELPWGSGVSRSMVWNQVLARHLPHPWPTSPTPSLASSERVSLANHLFMNCCVKSCFLWTQPRITCFSYLDAEFFANNFT